MSCIDETPNITQFLTALSITKENKVPGQCGIPAEIGQLGGLKLKELLFDLIKDAC